MTETISEDGVRKDVGRNDPCPCGSNKKYKKCCYRTHQLQKETEKSTGSVDDLVNAETTPWQWFKTLRSVGENNLLNLGFEFIHELGPLREKIPTTEAFIKGIADGDGYMFARQEFELRRLRHDGHDLILLLARGFNDPKFSTTSFECLVLRDNALDAAGESRDAPAGYRIWDVIYSEKPKSDLSKDPTFEEIGIDWSWA